MKYSAVILATVLLGATALHPASAAGLLGGVSNGVGSALGSSGSTGAVGVSGVATARAASDTGGTRVNGTLLNGGGSTVNVGLGSVIGGNSNVGLTLPGTDNSTLDNALGDSADTVNGVTDNGGGVGTLLGDTGLSGSQGGVGAALGGDGGLLGTDVGAGSAGSGNGVGGSALGGDVYGSRGSMAGLLGPNGNSPACRQNTAVLAQLLRTPYSPGTANRWARASGVQVVKIPVCAQIKGALGRALAASENFGRMQEMAEADPLINTSLARSRVDPRHVLGVGQGKNGVTVYVY